MTRELEELVQQVVAQVLSRHQMGQDPSIESGLETQETIPIPDVTALDLTEYTRVPDPANGEGLRYYKSKTPARIGVWRAGPRPLTETLLRFQADHAVAADAVFTQVAEEFLEGLGLFSVQTQAENMEEYLTRPDLGRQLSDEAVSVLQQRCQKGVQVQIAVADGLSSTAVEANVGDLLPALKEGLRSHNISTGTPFFVKFGRVGVMNPIGQLLDPEVVVVLIGERPGLGTAESLSAYLAYRPNRETTDAERNVISNIHRGGTPAVEAGAHLADLINDVLAAGVSGVKLQR